MANEQGEHSSDSGHKSHGSSSFKQEAQQTLGEASRSFQHGARNAADEQKQQGADRIAGLSEAVHNAAEQIGREMPQAANYIHTAAERLQSASSALREQSVEDLVAKFNGFARNQPLAAFAGCVLAGVALSRFIKSSSPRADRPQA